MASEMRAKVIDFAIHLPSNVNPYNALAQHLMEINKVPTLPLWSVLLQSGTILLYCGMLSGAIWLLRQRILTKNFRLVTISNLGLIEIDLITTWGLLGALYALISIPDLIYWQLVLTGKCRLSGGEIIVFGCKFVLLLHMSW
ncbi:hypothetical protein DFH28DRAFT_897021 [Melampsora americana]|nr:hypothetical protein DFH28DRAFT_897021 [Melampsora americana]